MAFSGCGAASAEIVNGRALLAISGFAPMLHLEFSQTQMEPKAGALRPAPVEFDSIIFLSLRQ